jgi:predicted RNA-binding protein with RPS1 domain
MSRFDELHVGDVLTGHVMRVLPFGVFMSIADGAVKRRARLVLP